PHTLSRFSAVVPRTITCTEGGARSGSSEGAVAISSSGTSAVTPFSEADPDRTSVCGALMGNRTTESSVVRGTTPTRLTRETPCTRWNAFTIVRASISLIDVRFRLSELRALLLEVLILGLATACSTSPTPRTPRSAMPPVPASPSDRQQTAPNTIYFPLHFQPRSGRWHLWDTGPVPRGSATVAWASSAPLERRDRHAGYAGPWRTIAGLGPEDVVVTAEATPWAHDPDKGPYPRASLA